MIGWGTNYSTTDGPRGREGELLGSTEIFASNKETDTRRNEEQRLGYVRARTGFRKNGSPHWP